MFDLKSCPPAFGNVSKEDRHTVLARKGMDSKPYAVVTESGLVFGFFLLPHNPLEDFPTWELPFTSEVRPESPTEF
ncbi:hypothetical protein D3C71_1798560 [compost metagenome]